MSPAKRLLDEAPPMRDELRGRFEPLRGMGDLRLLLGLRRESRERHDIEGNEDWLRVCGQHLWGFVR